MNPSRKAIGVGTTASSSKGFSLLKFAGSGDGFPDLFVCHSVFLPSKFRGAPFQAGALLFGHDRPALASACEGAGTRDRLRPPNDAPGGLEKRRAPAGLTFGRWG